jgi:hypothetical protein
VNFDGLYERARERGWTLSKSTAAARYGTMPILLYPKGQPRPCISVILTMSKVGSTRRQNNREPIRHTWTMIPSVQNAGRVA